jgi:hypothetical protein
MYGALRRFIERDSIKDIFSDRTREMLQGIYRRIRTAIEYHSVQALLNANRDLKPRHSGQERCFIVANGPSIKQQDLTPLRGETTFVMNAFMFHPDYQKISPTYHCVVDPVVWNNEQSTLNWLRDLDGTASKSTLLLPVELQRTVEHQGFFRGREVRYLLLSGPSCETGRIRFDLTRPMSGCVSVSHACLLTALYLGFRKIYLLGCDHDWLTHPREARHFYDEDPHLGNTFPDHYTYEYHMVGMLRLWRGYRHLRDFGAARGQRIYNATRGGFLDVFPRVTYEELVRKC